MERDEITMLVASNIKARMEAKDLDAAKLARMSKLNPTGIYDILSGKSRSPKIETLGKIAKGLGVPLASLFQDMSDDDLVEQLLFVMSELPKEERVRLVKTGRAWLPLPSEQ